jgi:predicted enzyme related to lactoylglutathione lyase
MGGKTVMPPMEIPGAVTMAQFSDPDGNVIGIIKANSMVSG